MPPSVTSRWLQKMLGDKKTNHFKQSRSGGGKYGPLAGSSSRREAGPFCFYLVLLGWKSCCL